MYACAPEGHTLSACNAPGSHIFTNHILSMLCAGTVTLPAGTEMVMPGDNVSANFELLSSVAMESGLRFAIREGGRTVGAGVGSKVLE